MKSLHNLINKTTRAAMQQDSQMKQVISQIVPATSMAHVLFCRLEAGRLRITVDNAAWIAKLRFSERQIVGALRTVTLDVVTISFHVAPAEVPVAGPVRESFDRRSNAAALALARLADTTAEPMDEANPADQTSETRSDKDAPYVRYLGGAQAGQSDSAAVKSVVRASDDSLRQELLKLAARLKEEP